MNYDWLFFKKGTRGQWNNMVKVLKKKKKTILSSKNSMMYGGRHTLW